MYGNRLERVGNFKHWMFPMVKAIYQLLLYIPNALLWLVGFLEAVLRYLSYQKEHGF
jgi:hypothetical protein